MKTNIFKNPKSPFVQTETDIDTVLNLIKNGLTKENVQVARQFVKGDSIYELIKKETPSFSPNASFCGKRCYKNIKALTGMIYLDFDDTINPKELQNIPYIYAYWKSFGGKGYGALASINNLTPENFKDVWLDLEEYFNNRNMTIDAKTKDITRQNIISYDPDLFINPACRPLNANGMALCKSLSAKYDSKPVTTSTFSNDLMDYITTNTFFDSDKIKYKTILDDYSGRTHIVIPEGKDCRVAYLPSVVIEGERNYKLETYTASILFNNPNIPLKRLQIEILRANRTHCQPKLPVKEVIELVNKGFAKHTAGTLRVKTNKKKIWINPESNLTTKNKRVIVNKESGALKTMRTKNHLRGVYLDLKARNEIVTQKMVEENSCRKIRTIKKYWNDIT
jgi:hypothetical protein